MKYYNESLNVLKAFACILVVLNHIHFPGEFGVMVYTLSHLGVPIFFMISGYYLYDSHGQIKQIAPKINHIAYLLSLHLLLYLFDFVIWAYINGTRQSHVIEVIRSCFTQYSLLDFLIFSKSLFGDGQWFLIALLEAYIFIWIFKKLQFYPVIAKYNFSIAVVLLLVHIFGRVVLINNGVTLIGPQSIYSTPVVRNVWFDAIPFMMLGVGLHGECGGG